MLVVGVGAALPDCSDGTGAFAAGTAGFGTMVEAGAVVGLGAAAFAFAATAFCPEAICAPV